MLRKGNVAIGGWIIARNSGRPQSLRGASVGIVFIISKDINTLVFYLLYTEAIIVCAPLCDLGIHLYRAGFVCDRPKAMGYWPWNVSSGLETFVINYAVVGIIVLIIGDKIIRNVYGSRAESLPICHMVICNM